MSTWRRHRAHRNSRASSIAPPRRGGLDDPRSPGNTALGAVRQCGSGRSLGRDHQVSTVRGCVSLLAESDLTPTHERRHRRHARCACAMGRQHRLRGETTTRPKRARRDDSEQMRSDRSSQFTWPVRQITAHLRSHQQRRSGGDLGFQSDETGAAIPAPSWPALAGAVYFHLRGTVQCLPNDSRLQYRVDGDQFVFRFLKFGYPTLDRLEIHRDGNPFFC